MGYVVKLGDSRPANTAPETPPKPDRSRTRSIGIVGAIAALLLGALLFFRSTTPSSTATDLQIRQRQEEEGLADRRDVERAKQRPTGYVPVTGRVR